MTPTTTYGRLLSDTVSPIIFRPPNRRCQSPCDSTTTLGPPDCPSGVGQAPALHWRDTECCKEVGSDDRGIQALRLIRFGHVEAADGIRRDVGKCLPECCGIIEVEHVIGGLPVRRC